MIELDMSFDPSNAIDGQRRVVPNKTRATAIEVTMVGGAELLTVEVLTGEPPNERVLLRERVDREKRRLRIPGGIEAGELITVRFPDGFGLRRVDVEVNVESSRG
jgi:hypothetical protein